MDLDDPGMLVGAKTHDSADVRPCRTEGSLILGTGVRLHEWDGPGRLVPAPPRVEEGPFTELRLAPSHAAAAAAAIGRRRAGSEQPIWSVVCDVLDSAFYVVEAAGVRIKDRHGDSRLVDGALGLRQEGENARERLVREERELVSSLPGATADGENGTAPMSEEWMALDAYFEEAVAAVEIPGDSVLRGVRFDWCLIASIPRLEALMDQGALRFRYVGTAGVRFRELLAVREVGGGFAGTRFSYFLARELGRDLLSVRRQQGVRDWLRFAGAVLGFASSIGGIGWLLSQLAAALG